MTRRMREPDHRIDIGPPPLPAVVKLNVAVTVLLVPVLVVSLLAGGPPVVILGITMLLVVVWRSLRPFRRIRVTAWNHCLEIDNGKGPTPLDRDAIASFEIDVPSTTVILQEGPGSKPFAWRGHLVQAVRHDGRRVPLFATLRPRRDHILEANQARLEGWLHSTGQHVAGPGRL